MYSSDDQCIRNLICRLSGSTCACPSIIPTGICDFPTPFAGSEYYWDSRKSKCVIAGLFNQSCYNGNYTCQILTQNTQYDLTANLCNCGFSKIFRNGTCIGCPTGWTFLYFCIFIFVWLSLFRYKYS